MNPNRTRLYQARDVLQSLGVDPDAEEDDD